MKDMKTDMYEHLTEKLIPFWDGLKDDEYGGFYGYLDYDLVLDKKAVKGCILNSRIMWFFSNAYLTLRKSDPRLAKLCLKDAQHAYSFMKKYCFDTVNGGIFWSLKYNGDVEDDIKHTYNQAFCIYALSTYFDASDDVSALEKAFEIADLIENRCRDDIGYLEAFNRDFTPAENDKLSENGVMAEKTMNTLLHVFEAYTELLRVVREHFSTDGSYVYDGKKIRTGEDIADRLRFMMDIVASKIYNPKLRRQEVFFDKNYNSIIDLHSYGHDIETSWLLERGCTVLDDPDYSAKIYPITIDLAAKIYERAYEKHSLLNECEKGIDNKTRIWWVQAESVVGFYNAAQTIGDDSLNKFAKKDVHKASEYMSAAEDIWNFIKEKVIDKRPGSEWFKELDENGTPLQGREIVEPWKCPYHNGRMCMEIIRRNL